MHMHKVQINLCRASNLQASASGVLTYATLVRYTPMEHDPTRSLCPVDLINSALYKASTGKSCPHLCTNHRRFFAAALAFPLAVPLGRIWFKRLPVSGLTKPCPAMLHPQLKLSESLASHLKQNF